MLITHKQQAGVTLVELMIGLLVGLIVVAAGINIFTTSIRGQTDNINLTRLNQDMRAMMDIMVRDIRRAGFVTSAPYTNFASLQENPFFDTTTDIAFYDTNGTNSCIVYSYNEDESTDVDADADELIDVETTDRLGFRLRTDSKLDMRRSGTTNANCTDGSWETITEPEVQITELRFTLTLTPLNVTSMATDTDGDGCMDGDDQVPGTASNGCISGTYGNNLCDTGEACNICDNTGVSGDPSCIYVRNVAIKLTGQLRDDNTVTQTITEQVRVRNDKFLLAIP
jgi:prepilin peptidase dependent protein B